MLADGDAETLALLLLLGLAEPLDDGDCDDDGLAEIDTDGLELGIGESSTHTS